MENPTVREILEKWLKDNGYDGLYTDSCQCVVGDLADCGEPCSFYCKAGHKIPCDPETCPVDGDCDFHIGKKG